MKFFESEDESPLLMIRSVFRSTSNGATFQIATDIVAILQLTMSIQNSLNKGEAVDSSLTRQILSVLPGNISQRDSIVGSEGGEQSVADIDSACVAFLLQGVAKAIQIVDTWLLLF